MAKGKKFSAFGGVFTPSILTILGVIMYLRLPWIVGQAGLISTLGIILVAHIISLTTGLSVASIATDKKVGPGGSYFMISRSLGLPIGGTLGLALFVGLSFSVSLYLIGFSETFLTYFGYETTINNIRFAGSIILFAVMFVTFISTSLAIKTQYLIMTIMALSLISVFFGKHDFIPSAPQLNTMPGAMSWIALFAIFFPAVTGFEAGVSMSGDLKDPKKDIPFGTIAAILFGLLVYIGLAFFFSFTVDRDLLVNNPYALFDIAWVPQLVVAGILGATLSSALGSILGAPRILQAISSDRITPSIFAKGYGASNEPRNALIFTYLIAQVGILIGDLNLIARIVTIFFIITYGFLNITYTVENWAGSDFRPSFKIPRIVSIIGAFACIIVMIQLDLLAMIGASFVLLGVFLFLKKKELTLQSGDTWNGIWTSLVKTGLRKLMFSNTKTSKWRPNIIVFSGGTASRPYLLEFAQTLVGRLGIFTSFQLIEDPSKSLILSRGEDITAEELNGSRDIITRKHLCQNIYDGIDNIARVYGFSGFEPNTILMGWAKNTKNPEKFTTLLYQLKKLDYNQVYLKHDKEVGFGKQKTIDLWWNGKGRNLSFGITLLKFITASPGWRQACIRIVYINYEYQHTESYYSLLKQIIEDNRVHAEIRIINNNIEQLPELQIIKSESYNTDLTILDMNDFGSKDVGDVYSKFNILCEALKTCMIIKSSNSFDEASISYHLSATQDEIAAGKIPEGYPESLIGRIKLPSMEIISNQIFNITKQTDQISNKFIQDGYFNIQKLYIQFSKELNNVIQKTLTSLEKDIFIQDEEDRNKAFLNSLNDFAFHSKKQFFKYSDEIIEKEKLFLDKSIHQYLDEFIKITAGLPNSITIKLDNKKRKKVKFYNTARYLLYYNRLTFLQKFQETYIQHSFSTFSHLRKIYNDVHELIGKLRNEEESKASSILQMERQKIKFNLEEFKEKSKRFYQIASHELFDELLKDIDNLSFIIEGQKSSFFSRKYKKAFKNEPKLRANIDSFPESWRKGLKTSINKGYLDYIFLSLNSRITAKILKHNNELDNYIDYNIINYISTLKEQAQKFINSKSSKNKEFPYIEYSHIKTPAIETYYQNLYNEIFNAIKELPESMEISGLNIAEPKDLQKLNESETYVLGIRKTVEFYISNEFIDFVKAKSRSASETLSEAVASLKDAIRLANFNIQANKETVIEEDNATKTDLKGVIEDYIKALEAEEQKILFITRGLESNLNIGLKKAFEPLSSSVIVQTSRSLKKKIQEAEKKKRSKRIRTFIDRINNIGQKQLVKLLYTRSEGILWTEKLEDESPASINNYEKIHSLITTISPSKEVMRALPFYYTNLFSGFSGIGEDFWVGMKEEIKTGEEGINRFFKGSSGIILITGKRSSGKSSLSKLLARRHFKNENTAFLRAPKEASSDTELFRSELAKAFEADEKYLIETLKEGGKKVVVINDLGLWWERKPGGDSVIRYIESLIEKVGKNVLFMVNVNSYAYKIIEQQTSLSSYSICNIECSPFDSKQLKDMIMLRHRASGLRFIIDNKEEKLFNEWDYAKLFNKLFNVSYGNPGAAIQGWLSCIEKVSGKTIYMRHPRNPDLSVFDNINAEQKFILLQLLLQRRFSLTKISSLLRVSEDLIIDNWNSLIRWGVIFEKFNGIYSINPVIEHHIIEKFQNMKLL
ncbi:MAG: amino acid permease [Bacteroidetes bacterium]|nr:amino acid permease [Bacteroidota bacterium]